MNQPSLETVTGQANQTVQQLKAALSAMPVGVSWATLSDQKIVFMNSMFTEIFGYEVGDFVDIAEWIMNYPFVEDQDLASQKWLEYFDKPDRTNLKIEPIELRIRCKDGTVKTILHSGVILPETGWALATFVDISDRKRDEMLLRDADRQSRNNQAIYRLLLEHSPEMVVLRSFDSSSRYVSSAVKTITGFTAEEYLALNDLDMIHPLDKEQGRQVLEGMQNGTLIHNIRYRALQKDGSYRWVEANVTGFMNEGSTTVSGYVSTIRDIAEQKKMEDLQATEYRQLSEVAALDELTGIANRRTFNRLMEKETRRQRRQARDLSLLLIDVDFFKQYNDLYGHIPGDECLRKIATTLKRTLRRDADLVARYGGEEFVMLLPMTEIEGGESIAHKVLEAIRELALPHAGSPSGIVTVSIGVTCGAGALLDQEALLEQADRALYRAKKSGRNAYRVIVPKEAAVRIERKPGDLGRGA